MEDDSLSEMSPIIEGDSVMLMRGTETGDDSVKWNGEESKIGEEAIMGDDSVKWKEREKGDVAILEGDLPNRGESAMGADPIRGDDSVKREEAEMGNDSVKTDDGANRNE
jgi:hypothetical protein